MAHQWWAHQVIGANVQSATMMSETLAQYSALMVMKHKYGDAKMKRFLSYELDSYRLGRGSERKKELPLYLKKHRIKTGESTLTIDVAGKPVKAGIDPVNKLIDRRPDDNTVAVSSASS